jgi:hypothetical protein
MASSPTTDPPLPPVKLDPLAALLSFVIPGLGQVYQGRVGKGLLFFGGLYLLFFYGMWMGQWRNVWLPDAENLPPAQFAGRDLGGVAKAVWYRPQFLGQFWIGAAAWPAVYQHAVFDQTKDAGPIFGKFERMPPESELNDLQRNGNKRWDLGWVYTVIAGVLNLLVIYDAFAGPMFRDPPQRALEDAQLEDAKASPGAKPAAPAVAAPPPSLAANDAPPPAPPPVAPVPPVPLPQPTPPAPQQGGA